MFKRLPQNSGLTDAIDQAHREMATYTIESDEYAKAVDQLDKLYKIQKAQAKDRVSMDTLAIVGANLVGIILIINHERVHVVTSKALGFVLKSR